MSVNELVTFCASVGFPADTTSTLPCGLLNDSVAMAVKSAPTHAQVNDNVSISPNEDETDNDDTADSIPATSTDDLTANAPALFENSFFAAPANMTAPWPYHNMADEDFGAALNGMVAGYGNDADRLAWSLFQENPTEQWMSFGMEGHDMYFPASAELKAHEPTI